jgi:hypothetical protein
MYNKEIQEVTKIRLTSLHIPLIGTCARRLLDSLFVNYLFREICKKLCEKKCKGVWEKKCKEICREKCKEV